MQQGPERVSRSSSKVSLLRQLGMDIFNSKCNFGTRFGQTLLLLLLLVAGFVPSSILTVQNFMNLLETTSVYDDHVFVTEMLSEIGTLIYELQVERGRTTLYLSASGNERQLALSEVLQQRTAVDRSVDELRQWPAVVAESLGSIELFKMSLKNFRTDIDSSNITYSAVLNLYSNINSILIKWMQSVIYDFAPGDHWPDLNAYHMITLATEYLGIERARGTVFWNKGFFTHEEFMLFADAYLNGDEFFYEAKQFSELAKKLAEQESIIQLLQGIQTMRDVILNNSSRPSVNNATAWFNDTTVFINIIRDIQGQLAKQINSKTSQAGKSAVDTVIYTTFLFLLELTIYPIYVALTCRLVFNIKSISGKLASKSLTLFRTQRRNREMLCDLYPPKIADKLMKGDIIEPETFEQATVCFVVMCDFESLVINCSGNDAVTIVNRVFDIMDDEILKYDVFKVETLEDTFLLVSGVPERNGPDHVTEIADLCLSLRRRMRSVCLDILPTEGIKLRFGVSTGPVAAGIVGMKMPRYLLFGDTVNMAARMQSTGKAQSIHLSPTSGSMLSVRRGYKLLHRHDVEVKGKGIMQTFWLLEKASACNERRTARTKLLQI